MRKLLNWIKRLFLQKNFPDGSWDYENEVIDEKDAIYEEVFGSINFGGSASRDWRKDSPSLEIQSYGDCVSFSRTNSAETKSKSEGAKDPDGDDWNFSDVDLAVGSGTSAQGNGLKKVAEYARRTGVSLEKDIPYTRNWSKRLKLFNEGKNKNKYKLGNWSWVKPDTNSLKSALEDAPLQIGIGLGYNWNNSGVIKKPAQYNVYHAIELLYIDEEGKKYIGDSYKPQMKVLDKDYPILFAMSFRDLPDNWRGINTEGERLHKRLIGKYILRAEANGELYYVAKDRLIYCIIYINEPNLEKDFQSYLRVKKNFTGVSEKDFDKLKKTIIIGGGKVDEKIELTIKK